MHHAGVIEVDTVRAYSMGSGYLTEVDVVLPRALPLQKAHDIGEALELALERLPSVQRALVHLDFESSHAPEYKRRRPGYQSGTSNSPPLHPTHPVPPTAAAANNGTPAPTAAPTAVPTIQLSSTAIIAPETAPAPSQGVVIHIPVTTPVADQAIN